MCRLCPHHAAGGSEAFIAKAGFPVVIKPVDNSGARGVQRLTAGMDIGAAFAYTKGFAYGGEVIAEKFIPGLQISTEGLFHDGGFYCTGFADRNYTRLDDAVPFMVEDGGDIPTVLKPARRSWWRPNSRRPRARWGSTGARPRAT